MEKLHKKFVRLFGKDYRDKFQKESFRELIFYPNVGRNTIKEIADFMERESIPYISDFRATLVHAQLPSWIGQANLLSSYTVVRTNQQIGGVKDVHFSYHASAFDEVGDADLLKETALGFVGDFLRRLNLVLPVAELSLKSRRHSNLPQQVRDSVEYVAKLTAPETTNFPTMLASIEGILSATTKSAEATKWDVTLKKVTIFDLPEKA